MKKKKVVIYSIIFMIAMVLLNFVNIDVYAADQGDLFPKSSSLNLDSTQPKLFDKYPLEHYKFDSERFGVTEIWAWPIKAITNALFLLLVYLNYVVNFLLMSCFKLDIFSLISSEFNDIVWAARDSIFTPLLKVITPIIGLAIIFNAALGKLQNTWRIIFNTLIVLIISFSFFSKPSLVIDMVTEMSDDVSSSVLSGTVNVVTKSNVSADDAVVNLGNVFWESSVIKPWQIIEFGDTATGAQEMDKILSLKPSDDDRKDMGSDFSDVNDLFTPEGQVSRLVMVMFIGLITIIIDTFVLILTGLTIMMQFGAIISAVIMVIAFTLSLLPNMGAKVAVQSLYNTFSFLLGKIGMTVLLSLYFTLNSVVYTMSNKYGWFLVTVLQAILIATIIIYRKKLLGFAYAITGGQQQAIRNVHKKGDKLKDIGNTLQGLHYGKKVYDDVKGMAEQRKDRKLEKKYEPYAQEYLKQRYTNEKRTAEANAYKFNNDPENMAEGKTMEPQYSNFVKTVNSRVDKGFNAFDERDIKSTVNMFKNLHKQGNNPVNLLTTEIDGRDAGEIKENQRNLENSIEYEMEQLENRRVTNDYNIRRSIKSDKESKLYNSKTAAVSKTADIIQKAADVTGVSKVVDKMIITSNSNGAMDEIREDRLNQEYQEMKREESILQSEENEDLNEERQVVNGYTGRPLGRSPIGSDRPPIRIVDTTINNHSQTDHKGNMDNERFVNRTIENKEIDNNITTEKEPISVNKGNRSSSDVSDKTNVNITKDNSNITVNSINRSIENKDMVSNVANNNEAVESNNKVIENISELNEKNIGNVSNENRAVTNNSENSAKKASDTKETENSISNKNESISNNSKSTENISELRNRTLGNVINENRQVNNNSENSVSRATENRETVDNVANRAETVANNNRVIENISEINNKAIGNVTNENRAVTNSSESSVNRVTENRETVNNETNRVETVANNNRVTENISEINNKAIGNVTNENRAVTNSSESSVNRATENRETVNNVTNRAETVANNTRLIETISEVNNKTIGNITNENKAVTNNSESSVNRTTENMETVNNVTNKNESIANNNRLTENVSEVNNKTVENVNTENKVITNNTENTTNRSVENKENISNVVNKVENFENKVSSTENIKETNTSNIKNTSEVINNNQNTKDRNVNTVRDTEGSISRIDRLTNLPNRHK